MHQCHDNKEKTRMQGEEKAVFLSRSVLMTTWEHLTDLRDSCTAADLSSTRQWEQGKFDWVTTVTFTTLGTDSKINRKSWEIVYKRAFYQDHVVNAFFRHVCVFENCLDDIHAWRELRPMWDREFKDTRCNCWITRQENIKTKNHNTPIHTTSHHEISIQHITKPTTRRAATSSALRDSNLALDRVVWKSLPSVNESTWSSSLHPIHYLRLSPQSLQMLSRRVYTLPSRPPLTISL